MHFEQWRVARRECCASSAAHSCSDLAEQQLAGGLMDRDLVIVGYWTDWDYLNGVLERTLGEVRPSRVVVVDLGEGRTFEIKAPVLYRIGERTNARTLSRARRRRRLSSPPA